MVAHNRDTRPLDGITVVSLEQAIAAPFATRQLADLGARVIKIERPGTGDFARNYDERVHGLSSHFVWVNRSKESLTLNLKSDPATGVMEQLLSRADVLVQNLAPGAAARMGLSFDQLKERFPKLIVCDISGYGTGGSYQNKKAYDLLVQSESGFLSVTGTQDNPAKAGISVADIAAGMYAYSRILAALFLRDRNGRGCCIEVSMLESMVEWMSYPMYYAFDGMPPPLRAGAAHATIYPYGPFPVGDGQIVMLGLQNEREWKLFCEQVLEQPKLTTDSRFLSNSKRTADRAVLDEIVGKVFSQLDSEEVIRRLDAAGIANARMNDMQGVWAHPQLQARDRWREIETPGGAVPALLPPGDTDSYEPRMDAVPDLGEHTANILVELGFSDTEIHDMRESNTV